MEHPLVFSIAPEQNFALLAESKAPSFSGEIQGLGNEAPAAGFLFASSRASIHEAKARRPKPWEDRNAKNRTDQI